MNQIAKSWVFLSGPLVTVSALYAIAMESFSFYGMIAEAFLDGRNLRAALLGFVLAALISVTYFPKWGRSIATGFLVFFMVLSGLAAIPDRDMLGPSFLERILGSSPSSLAYFSSVILVMLPSAIAVYVLGKPVVARKAHAGRPN